MVDLELKAEQYGLGTVCSTSQASVILKKR